MGARIACAVTIVGGTAGCFQPLPQPGLPCSSDGRCPSNLVCRDDVCVVDSGAVDGAASGDASGIDADACVSWNAPNLGEACALPPPDRWAPVSFTQQGGWVVDGAAGEIRKGQTTIVPTTLVFDQDGSSDDLRVFVLDSLVVPANVDLNLEGPYPIVFVVHGDVTIDGIVSASAQFTSSGAGASSEDCTTGNAAVAGTGIAGGGGGGAGGTYAADAGDGGAGSGDGVGSTGGAGASNGGSFGNVFLQPLLAGCRGSNGAGPSTSTNSGGGGGAIEITARGTITIAGIVSANGGGGLGGTLRRGGGGGGSGGAILIDGDIVDVTPTGRIAANGGGGGGGGNTTTNGNTGGAGRIDGNPATAGGAATGAGPGGSGGAAAAEDGVLGANAGTNTSSGGGGGGGSVGRIVITGRSLETLQVGSIVSPMPD